jgi:hypothetical protein
MKGHSGLFQVTVHTFHVRDPGKFVEMLAVIICVRDKIQLRHILNISPEVSLELTVLVKQVFKSWVLNLSTPFYINSV